MDSIIRSRDLFLHKWTAEPVGLAVHLHIKTYRFKNFSHDIDKPFSSCYYNEDKIVVAE